MTQKKLVVTDEMLNKFVESLPSYRCCICGSHAGVRKSAYGRTMMCREHYQREIIKIEGLVRA
jgi:hypothetical protein